ncbi:SHPRH [Mytilus coruscus]|uniref:SHPRH n=1 Tax=Mytilus coruscus TaxID=42192 RepID=A0A6J8DHI6_MYTCO|nr:SHPRH [Mytilus coruscus]
MQKSRAIQTFKKPMDKRVYDQIYEPVDVLFVIYEKKTKKFEYDGSGFLMRQFESGKSLSKGIPKKNIKERRSIVDLYMSLTPDKYQYSFADIKIEGSNKDKLNNYKEEAVRGDNRKEADVEEEKAEGKHKQENVEVRSNTTVLIDDTRRCIMTFSAMCNGEDSWVQCVNCCMWAHTLCVEMPDESSVIPFSCCCHVSSDPIIMTWPEKKNKPEIHQIVEALKLSDLKSLFDGNGLSNTIINFYIRWGGSDMKCNGPLVISMQCTSVNCNKFSEAPS